MVCILPTAGISYYQLLILVKIVSERSFFSLKTVVFTAV